jgi:hypothetical protein
LDRGSSSSISMIHSMSDSSSGTDILREKLEQ